MPPPRSTNKTEPPPPAHALSIDDVFYTLFRHKGKILICSLLGLIGAVGVYFALPPSFTSDASIMIRYVLENKATLPDALDPTMRSPDSRGENILNSESEILKSLDLALRVADAVGPERILAKVHGGTNRHAAAGMIRGGLSVDSPKKSNILKVSFTHPDKTIAQEVLVELVEGYRRRHAEVHQQVGVMDDYHIRQAEQARTRLAEIERKLTELRTTAGVVSLEDTNREHLQALSRIQGDLYAAEAELAEREANVSRLQGASGTGATNEAPTQTVPVEIADRYRDVRTRLDLLENRRRELLVDYKEAAPLVVNLGNQITQAKNERKQIESDHPGVTALSLPALGTNSGGNLAAEETRVGGLKARISELSKQLDRTRADANRLVQVEPQITQLQREREDEDRKLRFHTSSLDHGRGDESNADGKVTSIPVVQEASLARNSKQVLKPVGTVLAGGLVLGLALAFLIDLVFDRSIKRSSDLERRFGMQMFLSVPHTGPNGGRSGFSRLFRNGHPRTSPQPEMAGGSELILPSMESRPWDPAHPLSAYFEGLRDRLMTYFEVRNMTHKPKLVGVTSCNRGAGVSTLAAGLAASLSETGDGNVLLVDMNVKDGAAYQFQWGRPGCGLSEVLQTDKPGNSLIQEKLYMASAHEGNAGELPRVLPKRFAHLVPQMKASDFDYIIFDLPPVSQTSVTARLSSFMDMVMMVVESEKTGQETLKRAQALLQESGATAATVMNKSRKYLPQSLSQEL